MQATNRSSYTQFMKWGSAAILALGLGLLSSCGWYTNVPAQIKLVTVGEGLGASVTYQVDATRVAAAVKNPKITLQGEAGSIGVTYDTVTIEYLPNNLPLTPRTVTFQAALRVESSHQLDKDKNLAQGRGEMELPVISGRIVELGNPLATSRVNTQISAKVTLSGLDDANFPASLEFSVPINFLSSSLPR